MIETSWYRNNLTQLTDQRQGFHVFFQDLVSAFDDARNFWNDNASKDVFARFLNPHKEETQRLLTLLQDQMNLHQDVLNCLEAVQTPAREMRTLIQSSFELRKECAEHVQKSLRFTELAENERQLSLRAMEDSIAMMARIP